MTGTAPTNDRNTGSYNLRSEIDRSEIDGSASQNSAAPLTLTSVPAEKRTTRAKKPKGENGPAHATVVAFYFEVYERRRGTKPPFDGADGTAVSRLLGKVGGDADRACAAITGAFADDWTAQRTSIRAIASDPAKYLGAQPSRANRTPVQPNHGIEIDAEIYR